MAKYRYEAERAAFIARALPNLSSPTQLKKEKQVVADLFEKYPDMTFWKGLQLPFEMDSLVYFFGPRGRIYLSKAFQIFSFQGISRDPKPILDDRKHGLDRAVARKPRTVREFLNG